MHYIGIDIIEIARIKKAIARWGESFLHRVYTEPELRLYHKKPSSLAARFAGKEAVIKALEAQAKGISWKEIEILSDPEHDDYEDMKTWAGDFDPEYFDKKEATKGMREPVDLSDEFEADFSTE